MPKPIEPKPFWQRALEAFSAPFDWLQENIINPVLSVGLDPFVPDVERKPGEGYVEWKKRSWEEWQAPGIEIPVPWGRKKWRIDAKGVAEFAPWLLIPGAGQIGGGLIKGAGMLGRAAPVAKALGYGVKYSPWAVVERAAAPVIGKVGEALFKPFDKAAEVVGRRVFGQYVGKDVPPTVKEFTNFFKSNVTELLEKKKVSVKELRKQAAGKLQEVHEKYLRGEISLEQYGAARAIARKGGAGEFLVPGEALQKMRPESFQELTEVLANSTLRPYEKARAQDALEKLFLGTAADPRGTLPMRSDVKLWARAYYRCC